jgi:hypothetical protein
MVNAHSIARCFRSAAAIPAFVAFIGCAMNAHAAAVYSEDAVKAAYLYRFAGYVKWPDQDLPNDAPFIIEVMDAPGVAAELRRLLPGHPINHREAQVREISEVKQVGAAQIVYVSAGHDAMLRSLAAPASSPAPGQPALLVVSDEEGGLGLGSALNFLTIDRNVRFEVSLAAARRWGITLSSELLGVALRVQGGASQSRGGST